MPAVNPASSTGAASAAPGARTESGVELWWPLACSRRPTRTAMGRPRPGPAGEPKRSASADAGRRPDRRRRQTRSRAAFFRPRGDKRPSRRYPWRTGQIPPGHDARPGPPALGLGPARRWPNGTTGSRTDKRPPQQERATAGPSRGRLCPVRGRPQRPMGAAGPGEPRPGPMPARVAARPGAYRTGAEESPREHSDSWRALADGKFNQRGCPPAEFRLALHGENPALAAQTEPAGLRVTA